MGYIRLTQTVQDKGNLIKPEELEKKILDRNVDWYYSPFTYGEDALEYFSEHNRSIKGYAGEVFTDTLYWDLDSEALNSSLAATKGHTFSCTPRINLLRSRPQRSAITWL